MRFPVWLLLAAVSLCTLAWAQSVPAAAGESGDPGLAAYKAGNFEAAIPLLQAESAKAPGSAPVAAALLSSLVYQGRVDEAQACSEHAATAFPDAAAVTAARGEYAFFMGDMPRAERLFKAALKASDDEPRAILGMARVYRAASFYRTARLLVLRAHQVAPDDALITQAFLRHIPASRRQAELAPFAAAHPWLYRHYQEMEGNRAALSPVVEGKKLFEADHPPAETTLKFFYLMENGLHPRGVGLDLKIGNGHTLRMLFDTGASGIVVKQSAVDKAGLSHLGSSESRGIGDAGTRNTFYALADTCQIATLQLKNCLVEALEGKRGVAGDEDGLIGADFFQDYVVQIDFQKRLLHLKPLPPRPDNPQGYDRSVPPDEANFTPVFRFGHMLMISTTVNRESTGLFLLDTGASISSIDETFARLSTKLHGNEWMRVKGISGDVKKVYEANKAELRFGRFQQDNIGLTAFNLNNSPDHEEIRMSGILGIPVLSLFRLTIDYRNGLVNFDYVFK